MPYSVTSIGQCAFQGCSDLTTLTLGTHVKYIACGAFLYCDILTTIYCPCTTPPELDDRNGPGGFTSIFGSSRRTATLYVPDGCLSAYQNNEVYRMAHNRPL